MNPAFSTLAMAVAVVPPPPPPPPPPLPQDAVSRLKAAKAAALNPCALGSILNATKTKSSKAAKAETTSSKRPRNADANADGPSAKARRRETPAASGTGTNTAMPKQKATNDDGLDVNGFPFLPPPPGLSFCDFNLTNKISLKIVGKIKSQLNKYTIN